MYDRHSNADMSQHANIRFAYFNIFKEIPVPQVLLYVYTAVQDTPDKKQANKKG